MNRIESHILSINSGSSSIKFSLYEVGEPLVRKCVGQIAGAITGEEQLIFQDLTHAQAGTLSLPAHVSSANFLVNWLGARTEMATLAAIGHRMVHGMNHVEAEFITPSLLTELAAFSSLDPEHRPREIELIEACERAFPRLPQIACFDTAFHRSMPRVAKLLPIPRRYQAEGIERYGFHGLSYQYLLEELQRVDTRSAARGRVIFAHLGSGASLAAVKDGQSVDTSMGFTPSGGLPMGSRSGDLDPGLMSYLSQTQQMTAPQFEHMINHESGLLGIAETSSDMRDLLERENEDIRAADAVALFCYQTKKWLGAFAAVLSGLDTLVFSGGIGANLPVIRARICEDLAFLGIELDEQHNRSNASVISGTGSRVVVRVIPTDEESVIAQAVIGLLRGKAKVQS